MRKGTLQKYFNYKKKNDMRNSYGHKEKKELTTTTNINTNYKFMHTQLIESIVHAFLYSILN